MHLQYLLIAAFLAYINPNWKEKEWSKMLCDHLEMVKMQIDALLCEDYNKSVALHDKMECQAFEMADEMSKGIIEQFPNMFK